MILSLGASAPNTDDGRTVGHAIAADAIAVPLRKPLREIFCFFIVVLFSLSGVLVALKLEEVAA